MRVAYVIDDVFLGHRATVAHPERPERLLAIRDELAHTHVVSRGERVPTRQAKEEELGLVHGAAYLADLSRRVPGQSGYLDEDTFFSPGSHEAALCAAGAAVDLARLSVSGQAPRGLAVVRPPGHHAEPDRAMGFCLLNNVAIAAASARQAGLARVAVLDWDVHHGNGTQAAFYADPSVMYLSSHQYPFYPGTGASGEVGVGQGAGATVNVPLPAGSGDAEYAAAFDEIFAPALLAFRPELILVSAGFDALASDPLAQMRVTVSGYRRMAEVVRRVADVVCDGRMVCVLEGGYDLGGLAACAAATFEVLCAETTPELAPADPRISAHARTCLEATKAAHAAAQAPWALSTP
jgi:acetoin utilization deacetylase AcuC-like enzyme